MIGAAAVVVGFMAVEEVVNLGAEVVVEETVATVNVPGVVVVVVVGLAEMVEVINVGEEEGEVKRPSRRFIRQSHLPNQEKSN